MALQTGTWAASVGGENLPLTITSVGANGSVKATLGPEQIGGLNCAGFWDEDSQRLSLISSGQGGSLMLTGYQFTDPINITGVSGSVIFTLAGIVDYFGTQPPNQPGPAPSAKQSSFGWYAQIGVD